MNDLYETETLCEQTTSLDYASPLYCLSLSPPPGSEAEPRNFTREQASRNPSSRTLPRQRHRTDWNEPTTEFYARTSVLQPSSVTQTCYLNEKEQNLVAH